MKAPLHARGLSYCQAIRHSIVSPIMPSIRGLIIGFSGIVFLCAGTSLLAADDYAPGPDSFLMKACPRAK